MGGIYLNSREILTVASELSDDSKGLIPSQSHVRLAISAAYYALFHDLITTALVRTYGPDLDRHPEKNIARRWYLHGEMKTVCRWVLNIRRGKAVPQGIEAFIQDAPEELGIISDTFIELQSARCQANYDDETDFAAADARGLIQSSDEASSLIPKLQGDRVFDNYLMLLLGGPKFADRLAAR